MSTMGTTIGRAGTGGHRWRVIAFGVALLASSAAGALAGRLSAGETTVVGPADHGPVDVAVSDGHGRFGNHRR